MTILRLRGDNLLAGAIGVTTVQLSILKMFMVNLRPKWDGRFVKVDVRVVGVADVAAVPFWLEDTPIRLG